MIKKIGFGSIEFVITVAIYIGVIFLVINVAKYAFGFSYEVFDTTAHNEEDTSQKTLVIGAGMTAQEVGERLEELDIVEYARAFELRVRFDEATDKIIPGTYKVSASMNVEDIIKLITTSGNTSEDEFDDLLIPQDVNQGDVLEGEDIIQTESQTAPPETGDGGNDG